MYFPVGWPTIYNSSKQTGVQDILISVRFNRSRSQFVALSKTVVYLWLSKPRLLLATWKREEKPIHDEGCNSTVYWNPDSQMLAVITDRGFVILLDLVTYEGEYIYQLENQNPRQPVEQLLKQGIARVHLSHKATITLKGELTSASPRSDELFICTTEGWLYRLTWAGVFNSQHSTHISDLMFCVDLDTPSIGAPLVRGKELYITNIECSVVLGGFAIILSDGRGGFLSSNTAQSKPEDIVGIFAKDLTNATCLAVNIKYQIIVFGQTMGQADGYCFDDLTGGLVLSHTYKLPKKDYPDQGVGAGGISHMCWSPDGSCIATMWSHYGVAVWSVFGALLMCVQFRDQTDVFRQPLALKDMDWGMEGYELLMVPQVSEDSTEESDFAAGDLMQIHFVKSAVSVNPCMSNRQHLFLQGATSLNLNVGDVMLGGQGGASAPSMHFSNKHWQTFQLPHNYLTANSPIRYAVVDESSKYIAVAGVHGYTHYTLFKRKWKMFGNETQERNVTCRGGMVWWNGYLVVGCYNFYDAHDEVRLHHHSANLDLSHCERFPVSSPIFLINIYNDLLLVYCADCSVTFYRLSLVEDQACAVNVEKVGETSLMKYIIHPITVTSLGFTSLKNEEQRTFIEEEEDGVKEAHSLIANVAGKLLMLQKDKPQAQSATKIAFLTPVCLASCVENVWYMVNPGSSKPHLAESLWLACGAQGMQAWLPLFHTRRPLGFQSRRVMLHFNLQLYPLAVLFEDAVILGIGNEDQDDCLSPLATNSNLTPYFTLEKTTQVYLPQILKQLLRRNLGDHALEIARSCFTLSYFPHVLELMLHEVLEKEATASNPIPDPLLPRIVEFIQEFPQYLETVCHCARKTEVALWQHLFSVVGNPINLFESCYATGKLETAASYLLVLQSLESPAVSRQQATKLLDAALESRKLDLASDLVRFLRAIGRGDNDSPPRTPTSSSHTVLTHKTSFHQNMSLSSSGNIEDVIMPSGPGMIPLQRQNSRTNQTQALVRTSSKERSGSVLKDRTNSVKERPSNLKLSKQPSDKQISTTRSSLESCEYFYTETILCRYARTLLSAYALKDLGEFGAKLSFDLLPWFTKERYRASCVEDFVAAMSSLHDQFDWPYPETTDVNSYSMYLRSQSTVMGQVKNQLTCSTPMTPLGSESNLLEPHDGDIEARLLSLKDTSLTCDDVTSETMSLYTTDGFNNDVIQMNNPNIQLPQKSQAKLRYFLCVFSEARCLDWTIILSIMLFNVPAFSIVLEKAVSFKDLTPTSLDGLLDKLHLLLDWLAIKCPAYQSMASMIVEDCEAVHERISLCNEEENSASEVEAVTMSQRKPRVSKSSDQGVEHAEQEATESDEENDDAECSIM